MPWVQSFASAAAISPEAATVGHHPRTVAVPGRVWRLPRRNRCNAPRLAAGRWGVESVGVGGSRRDQPTFGSLKASGSPLKSPIGTQAQNTFLSP